MLRIRRMILPVWAAGIAAGCGTDGSTPVDSGSTPADVLPPIEYISGGTGAWHPDTEVPPYPGPDGFVEGINNPYLFFAPGRVFTYEGVTADGFERIRVEVTHQTKAIIGVTTTVVLDSAFVNNVPVEVTLDWFAQDEAGNVWYFGEDSRTLDENGNTISTDGSWEAGVDGATPGISMLAEPEIGMRYQQEFAEGVAEDRAKVLSLSAHVEVDFGIFDGCLQTLEWTPLDPPAREHKYYKPGVGFVLETQARGRKDPIGLVSISGFMALEH